MEKRAVVVTTGFRGVFFGYVKDDSKAPAEIELEGCRMCVAWSSSVRGVLGLAATGPNNSCRITAPSPDGKLYTITGIFEATPEAVIAWEAQPWN